MLSNKRTIMAFAINTLAIICIMYVDPILAVQLTNMGMSEKNVGFAFAVIGFAFGLGGPVAGLVCSKLSKAYVMELGLVLVGCSQLLVGPSYYIGFQPEIWVMFIGLFFMAFFAAFNYIPVIPEIIEATKMHERDQITRAGRLAGYDERRIESMVEKRIEEIGGQLADKASAL